MNKTRIITIIVILCVVAVPLGFLLISNQSEDRMLPESASQYRRSIDLGITYLQIAPQLSAYYGIGVESGALVTEVLPDSPAERSGIREGDVIISFNDARLEKGVSLLGMMMACPTDQRIVLEVCRGENVSTVELIHIEK